MEDPGFPGIDARGFLCIMSPCYHTPSCPSMIMDGPFLHVKRFPSPPRTLLYFKRHLFFDSSEIRDFRKSKIAQQFFSTLL